MTADMFWLAMSVGLSLVIWIPYTALYGGLVGFKAGTTMVPPHHKLPDWAQRLHRSHVNLMESLVPFAILVLMLQAAGKADASSATAAAIFFLARVAHAIVYAFGIPWLRPVTFTVGWLVNMLLLWKVLAG